MDELMSKLSDLLLASGFNDPYLSGSDDERTMQALYDAILDALLSGGVLPDDRLQELVGPRRRRGSEAADRRSDQADHGAAAGVRLCDAGARLAGRSGAPPAGAGGAAGRARGAGAVRSHRQGAGLPRLPGAARPARLARQEQLRPARHPRPRHRDRSLGRHQTLRVRRHAEPGRQRDADQRDQKGPARDGYGGPAPGSTGSRARRPGHRAGRVSELVRHGDHARLQPQHDPLWRRPLHARPSASRWRCRS